ncbi:MAG: hypothetical protein KOO62_09505 [candidate division Zixibacteria bacterium]|nr:hypothetical protein [candidate division Zixibacteria bacterium]
MLTCDFCGSVLRVIRPEIPSAYVVPPKVNQREVRFSIDRYLKENDQPLTGSDIAYKRVYYPYWRVEAIALKTRNRITSKVDRGDANVRHDSFAPPVHHSSPIKEKHTDVTLSPFAITIAATGVLTGIPPTLGVRTDYLKVTLFAEGNLDERYDVLPVTVPWDEAEGRVQKSAQGVGMITTAEFGRNRTELYRPTGSIVYFPFFLAESLAGRDYRRWIVDGVSGRVQYCLEEPEEIVTSDQPAEVLMKFGQLEIEHHRCAHCGVDLPGEQSHVYICHNCDELTIIEEHPVFRNQLQVTTETGAEGDMLVPFWSMQFSHRKGWTVGSILGGSPDLNCLVIPAFRTSNFEEIYKLACTMTAVAPRLDLTSLSGFKRCMQSVGIGPTEALITAQVVCARARLGVSASLDIPDIQAAVTRISLFFVPFHLEHYFMSDSVLNSVTFSKQLLQRP